MMKNCARTLAAFPYCLLGYDSVSEKVTASVFRAAVYTPTALQDDVTTQKNLHSRENLEHCTISFIPVLHISDSKLRVTRSPFS
jgi:hypothetical protein